MFKGNTVIPGLLAIGLLVVGAAGQTTEKVLIRSTKPYTGLVNAITASGGKVTYQYKYINAVSAEVPAAALPLLAGKLAPGAISKDLLVPAPQAVNTLRGRTGAAGLDDSVTLRADSWRAIATRELHALSANRPAGYLANNALSGASALHARGISGSGIVVAVIDSGIRPGFPHIELDGSVIGCEDFVGDGLGCSNFSNNPHGTFVAGMISANVIFEFSGVSTFRDAVLAECPACFLDPPANTLIPLLGSAPSASIYALRVFGATGGSPSSVILKGVERAIELRESGVNLRVVNMSLGGGTPNPAGDLYDQAIDAMFARGILPVVAASNNGPSSLTVGSPATAISALTVGAASLPRNERILRRLQFGPAVGPLYRPYLLPQTAYFSSRGPDANGRINPDVTANGFACFGQGYGSTDQIGLYSGTSFSAPTVSGIAALLAQAYPNAAAGQIWNAIRSTADPAVLGDGSTYLDQGAGYVNALAAANLLAAGGIPGTLAAGPKPNPNVKVNIETSTFLRVRTGFVQETTQSLKPGQRHELVYHVTPNTSQIIVTLDNVQKVAPALQNQLFGDDMLVTVHSAETSAIGTGDYDVFALSSGGTWIVSDPEPGMMRITLSGDWTNAGNISGRVRVIPSADPLPLFTTQGKIADLQVITVPVTVSAGTARAEFRLGWREDWGSYPSNDLDLILVTPGGTLDFSGATLRNPEVVTLSSPAPGQWIALISGFQIATGDDKFTFRAALDGRVVR